MLPRWLMHLVAAFLPWFDEAADQRRGVRADAAVTRADQATKRANDTLAAQQRFGSYRPRSR